MWTSYHFTLFRSARHRKTTAQEPERRSKIVYHVGCLELHKITDFLFSKIEQNLYSSRCILKMDRRRMHPSLNDVNNGCLVTVEGPTETFFK